MHGPSIFEPRCRFDFTSEPTGVIHVMTRRAAKPAQQDKETPMPTFTIDTENNVTAYTTPDEAAQADASLPRFSSEAELAKLAADWPTDRLIDLWNSIPGNSRLTKLGLKAAARIWKALPPLVAPNGGAPQQTKTWKQ